MPDTCLGPICEWIHMLSQWLKIHILPFGPLVTAGVAIFAGAIALYSIHVTRSTARKRASVDFFLKTEMDQALLLLYDNCQKHIGKISSSIKSETTLDELLAMEGYGAVRTYLNIHELIAVGIRNKVFDEKVAYLFWSAILVMHCKAAEALIIFSRKEPEEAGAYWQLSKLNRKWARKIGWWRWRQQVWKRVSGSPVSPAADPLPPRHPHEALPPEQIIPQPIPPQADAQSELAGGHNPAQPSPQTIDEHPLAPKGPNAPGK
jgi:Domain of unknown function (DUF4760)